MSRLRSKREALPADSDGDDGAILDCNSLSAGYGRSAIVRSFTFAARPGEVIAILGPNGAGKTTLLETVAGLLPRIGGLVSVGGHHLASGRPVAANRAGVVLVKDTRALFGRLTVKDNVDLAKRDGGIGLDGVADLFPSLGRRWNQRAGTLSGGEQQMLAVARAIVQSPRVLMIDEMSMGLAPTIVQDLLPVVRSIAASSNAAVLLVEQHVRIALQVADRALVLVGGEVTLTGRASDLISDRDALTAAYFGDRQPTAPVGDWPDRKAKAQ